MGGLPRGAAGGHGSAEGSQAVAEPLKEEARSPGALTALALSLSFPPAEQKPAPVSLRARGPPAVLSAGGGRASRVWPAVTVATAVKGAGCAWNAAVCLRLLCDTHTLPGLFSNGVLFAGASERTGSPASPLPANLGGGTEASKISLLRPPPVLRGSLLCCPRSPFGG